MINNIFDKTYVSPFEKYCRHPFPVKLNLVLILGFIRGQTL
jgi:hypothetical protein